jgi:tetratricopeptide (TPR) repeat protein
VDLAATLAGLGTLSLEAHDPVAAKASFERALTIVEKALGPDSPHTAKFQSNLAGALQETGEIDRAIDLSQRSLRTLENSFGPDHPSVAITVAYLGQHHMARQDFRAAKPHVERALRIRLKTEPANSIGVQESMWNLAFVLAKLGQTEDARPLYASVVRMRLPETGAIAADWAGLFEEYASMLRGSGNADSAAILDAHAASLRAAATQ